MVDDDLEHVKKVCNAFNITNSGDYHDLYVSLDVALLADVLRLVCSCNHTVYL